MAKQTVEEMWEQMLTGSYPRLHGMRKILGRLALAAALQAVQRALQRVRRRS